MKVTVDIDLEDVLDEAKWNEVCFKDEFAEHLKASIVLKLKEQCNEAVLNQVRNPITEKVAEFAEVAVKKILSLDESQKFNFLYNYNTYELTVAEFIKMYIEKESEREISSIIRDRARKFTEEMKKRYDMTFAALIVDNMRKQNLLADERLAELIKA